MWKRPLTRNDIFFRTAVIIIPLVVTSLFVKNTHYHIFAIIALIIGVTILLGLYLRKDNLPGESRYNSKNLIEFHVGNSCKDDIVKLGNFLIDTIYIAQKEKSNIVFSSDLFKESTLKLIFQSAAVLYKPSFADQRAGKINNRKYMHKKKQKNNPLINCYIYADKVNEKNIETIKRICKISEIMSQKQRTLDTH